MRKIKKKIRKILVTGGSGYIGSCLAAYLNKKYKVFTLDIKKKNIFLNKKIIHFKCNLNNEIKLKKIIYKIQPDTIVHLAGQSTIDMVDKKINKYIVNNIHATNSLLKIIRSSNVKKFIFSSTASVYKNSSLPLSENMLLKSNNSYGRTKIINEKKIIKSFKKTKTKYCILRFFNVSGCLRKYKIGEFHSPETHLIPIIINSFLKNKKISIYGNQYKTPDGTCIRNYIHIDDVLKGITKSIKYLEKNNSEIFNLGSNNSFSVLEIINKCSKLLKINPGVKINKKRKYDTDILLCKIQKAKNYLKWYPKNSTLKKIINDEFWWYKFLKKIKVNRNFIY